MRSDNHKDAWQLPEADQCPKVSGPTSRRRRKTITTPKASTPARPEAITITATPKSPQACLLFEIFLLRIPAGREAARAAFDATPPPDCSERRWALALRGLRQFVEKGYADQAAPLDRTPEEL